MRMIDILAADLLQQIGSHLVVRLTVKREAQIVFDVIVTGINTSAGGQAIQLLAKCFKQCFDIATVVAVTSPCIEQGVA